ncbi:MAG: pyridoxal-phosphate dependent enzyme [Nitrospira sp.]|nr:pyridoxal-phosphate dependent enzyme [Nitrospira sp.]
MWVVSEFRLTILLSHKGFFLWRLTMRRNDVVTASTGNAGAALAGMAAGAGQQAVIFAPRSTPPAKIAHRLAYKARVLLVDGNYDQAFDLLG